jgi:hypothetical protein
MSLPNPSEENRIHDESRSKIKPVRREKNEYTILERAVQYEGFLLVSEVLHRRLKDSKEARLQSLLMMRKSEKK